VADVCKSKRRAAPEVVEPTLETSQNALEFPAEMGMSLIDSSSEALRERIHG
jgi:hypothetical protein